MKKIKYIVPGVTLALLAVLILTSQDPIIIRLGIRMWKVLRTAAYVMGAGAVLLVLAGIVSAVKAKKNKPEEIIRDSQLDTSRDLKNHELRAAFNSLLNSADWEKDYEMSTLGHRFIDQMKQIDDYQDRLGKLLSTNAVKDEMGDWEEILSHAENKMCLTMRKGINCLQVYSQADRRAAIEKITGYIEDNDKILDQVKGFIFAATDFINHRGDSKYDEISEIGVYKDALNKVLEDDF